MTENSKEKDDTILAIRMSKEDRELIEKAAKEAGIPMSTFIRETALTCSKDSRKLETLLKAVLAYLE